MTELRRRGVGVNEYTRIRKGAVLTCEPPVMLTGTEIGASGYHIGCYTYIRDGYLGAVKSIGRFCSIGPGLRIGDGQHPTHWLSTHPIQYGHDTFFNFSSGHAALSARIARPAEAQAPPSSIGNDVWIGANVTIMRGVHIGDGAVIGAGSVITKDVPPYAIVGGVPARVIRYRFTSKIVEDLVALKWWRYGPDILEGLSFDDINSCIVDIKAKIASGEVVKMSATQVQFNAMSVLG